MQHTGTIRFVIHVEMEGNQSTSEALHDMEAKISDLMANFLAMARIEGVGVTEIETPYVVCY